MAGLEQRSSPCIYVGSPAIFFAALDHRQVCWRERSSFGHDFLGTSFGVAGDGIYYRSRWLVEQNDPHALQFCGIAVSTTEQWAGAALAGPNSRKLLGKLFKNIDVSNEGIQFMGYKESDLFGVPARIFRISFSGELAYEINVESDYGIFMWKKIIELGKEMNIEPYGTEALSTLRIEMGHVAGSEIDGRVISSDLSLEGMLSKKKDFIGKRSLFREAFINPSREKIVGVIPIDKKTMIPEGSHLVNDGNANLPNPKLGHVSASCWSVEYNNPFSLAILQDGKNKIGEKLYAVSPLKNKNIPVEIISSHYVDPKGERVRS